MRITINHPASSYGIPVILDDRDKPMDYGPGIQAIRRRMGLSVASLAERLNVSPRTIEGWEQGRPVPAEVLVRLNHLLP